MKRDIAIDRNVPLRSRGAPLGNQNRAIYPWDGMNVGDSFFAAGVPERSIVGAVSYQKARRGWSFAVRSEGDGCRVWRIK